MAVCAKFILNILLVSIIFGFVLGAKKEAAVGLHTVILGLVLGIESALIIVYTTSFVGLSVLLNIFRTLGISLTNSFGYSTVAFIAFAYIVVFELVIVALSARIGEAVQTNFEKKQMRFLW